MSDFSRRSFLAGLSAIPFAAWFEAHAAAQQTFIRFNIMSKQGQAMLKIYAGAVGTMVSTPEANPVGWLFQWYTHAVRDDRTKASELARVYPAPSPRKNLAQEMWDTCQPHHAGGVEDFFLPWHRMYVFFLERMVRKVSGHPEFTLPYWNYSSATPSGPTMPPAFISPGNAANSLFRPNRNALANTGHPINQNNQSALDLGALSECTYSPSGARQGFNSTLDLGLHGNVHVLVGNSTRGMGTVPWAANDPIFWIHHCNIDRLWASWNRAGRTNPTTPSWLNKQFVFADENGNRVVGRIKDFANIAPLKYTYDRFEPVPACPPTGLAASVASSQRHAVAPAGGVSLGATPVRVPLTKPPDAAADVTPLTTKVRNLRKGRRLFLVLKNLHADAQPGILYHVFLELPTGASASSAAAYRVGVINFFDSSRHAGQEGAAAMEMSAKFVSFDVTDLAKALLKRGQLSAQPNLTIAPVGQPESAANPLIGDISLVEE